MAGVRSWTESFVSERVKRTRGKQKLGSVEAIHLTRPPKPQGMQTEQ